jgi:A/G-specific adenine glycosylase
MQIESDIKRRFRRAVTGWYGRHRRAMPWRNTDDPYKIWVSEVMLQQTQVATVEPYYRRFVDRFSTVHHLARAQLDEVLKAWEGLGYYGRARHLHRAAKEIVSRFGGQVPDNLDDLLSLPGVGRYTAGAVLSIAYDRPVPVIDGNVKRLLARVFHITENVDKVGTQRILWELAGNLLPRAGVGVFNQGMMELGAVVCKSGQPLCDSCPLAGICEAKRLSIQADLPVRSSRKPIPHYDVTAGIIYKDEKLLITRRPPKGLLGGLWEFPGGKLEDGEDLESCLIREIREELGIRIEVLEPMVVVKHAYSHFRITLHAFRCKYAGGKIRLLECDDYRWITPQELTAFAFPAADRRIIEVLMN